MNKKRIKKIVYNKKNKNNKRLFLEVIKEVIMSENIIKEVLK